jgi:hypothetical protein
VLVGNGCDLELRFGRSLEGRRGPCGRGWIGRIDSGVRGGGEGEGSWEDGASGLSLVVLTGRSELSCVVGTLDV